MGKKTVTIEGGRFKNLEDFFKEIDRVLTKDLDFKTGHNMNAFNDILWGGFGVHDYEEPIRLIWDNSVKSRKAIGEPLFNDIVALIQEHEHVELIIA
jgi:RNAse (barnase) inhibitor barstar